jgi:O-antigen/teichoic acid export membrane protein
LAANLVLAVYLVRRLAPENFGLFSIGLLVLQFAAVPFLSAAEPAANRTISLASRNGPEVVKRLAMVALMWSIGIAVVVAAAIALGAGVIASTLFGKPEAGPVLVRMAPGVVGVAITTTAAGVGLGLGVPRQKALLDQGLRPVLVLLCVAAFVEAGEGLPGAGLGFSIGNAIAGAVALVSLRWLRGRTGSAAPRLMTPLYREHRRLGITLAVTAVLTFIAGRVDLFLVARLAQLKSVAIYSFVRQLFIPGVVALGAVGQAIGMRVPVLEHEQRFEELGKLLQRASYWTALAAVPLFGGIAALGSRFLELVDPRYVVAVSVVVALALGQALNATSGPVGRVLILSGHPGYNLFNNMVSALLGFALGLLLIPPFGLLGAALAAAGSVLLQNALMVGQVWRLFGIAPFSKHQSGPWVASTVAALLIGATGLGLDRDVGGFAVAAAGYAMMATTLTIMLMPARERMSAWEKLASLVARREF